MIQLEGKIEIGAAAGSLTDFSDDITSIVVNYNREAVTRNPTFGQPYRVNTPGAHEDTITVNFLHDYSASNVWSELWDALQTADGELLFSATLKDGAVSASNPRFTGKFYVTSLEIGGEVGTRNSQAQTFSAYDIAKVTTP